MSLQRTFFEIIVFFVGLFTIFWFLSGGLTFLLNYYGITPNPTEVPIKALRVGNAYYYEFTLTIFGKRPAILEFKDVQSGRSLIKIDLNDGTIDAVIKVGNSLEKKEVNSLFFVMWGVDLGFKTPVDLTSVGNLLLEIRDGNNNLITSMKCEFRQA